jgi:hypothetical protein
MKASRAKQRLQTSALTSRAGDAIRHRRRLFFRACWSNPLSTARHGLNPGLDGRLRHRREQGQWRQLRAVALAGGSDALRFVACGTLPILPQRPRNLRPSAFEESIPTR